jgi:hypothetical protein
MSTRPLSLALCVLTACGGGAASTQTSSPGGHPIHLARHLPVGYAWGETVQFSSTQRETVSAGGTVVRDTTTTSAVDLAGDYSVLSLDAGGQPRRLRLAIDHMTIDSGTGPHAAPVPGVIVIERGDPGSIVGENGEAIAEDTVALLHHVVPEHARPVDDDAVFGTRQPQVMGATWPLDANGAAHGLAALQLTVDPSNVSGGTTLVSVGNESGIDVLVLRTVIHATHIGFPGLPPGSSERRADVQATVDVALPRDVGIVPLHETEESTVDIEVEVPTDSGVRAVVDVTMRETVTHVRTLR